MAGVQCLAPEVPSCQLLRGRKGYKGKEHLTLRQVFTLFPLNISLLASVRERIPGWQTFSHIHTNAYVHAQEQTFNMVYLRVISKGELQDEDTFTIALESSLLISSSPGHFLLVVNTSPSESTQQLGVCSSPQPKPEVKPSLTDLLHGCSPSAVLPGICDANSQ